MSLTERVRRASQEPSDLTDANASIRLDRLRQELFCRLSSNEIAEIASENTVRAKNEIKSVCANIFASEEWARCLSEERENLVEEILNAVFGLGPLENLLRDEDITEIMVNGSQSIFFERDGKLFSSNQVFSDDEQVRALIDRIIGPLGRRIDEASPMVNARLAQGHRVNAIIPPLALDGPILTIRKFRDHLYTLDEMVDIGSMDREVRQFLIWAVLARKNIAVSGGTGSGKTTLLNALSCVIPEYERIITIEDSAELKFSQHPHVVRLEARSRNAEGSGEVTIRDLVVNALRMRPDRIIVGECRGGEALDMLQAMNTGHDGSLTTLHANSPSDAVIRLATMVRYAADIPISVIESQIASAIDLIVQTARAVDGRRYVHEIAFLKRRDSPSNCEARTIYKWDIHSNRGVWLEKPDWIENISLQGIASLEEVFLWQQLISESA